MTNPNQVDAGPAKPSTPPKRPWSLIILVDTPAFAVGLGVVLAIAWALPTPRVLGGGGIYAIAVIPGAIVQAVVKFVLEAVWEQLNAPPEARWKR